MEDNCMAECKKCGTPLDDTQKFCPKCGHKVSDGSETQLDFKKAVGDFVEKVTPKGDLSSNPIINDFRLKLSSPGFLAFLCLYSVLTLAVLINVQSMNLWGFSEILKMYNILSLGITNSVETYLRNSWLGKIVILVKLVLFIPYGITCYGLWEFFLSSRNPINTNVSLKGIKLIDKLYMILRKAYIVIGIILEVVLLIMAIVAMSSYGGSGAETLLVNLLIAIYFGINIYFINHIRKAIGKVIETVSSGVFTEQHKIKKAIFVYIVFGAISFIFASGGWFISIVGIAALVVLIIVLNQYNTTMTEKYLKRS
jgi:hypothetical protein